MVLGVDHGQVHGLRVRTWRLSLRGCVSLGLGTKSLLRADMMAIGAVGDSSSVKGGMCNLVLLVRP